MWRCGFKKKRVKVLQVLNSCYSQLPNNNWHYYLVDTQPIEPAPGWQEQYVLHIDSYSKLRYGVEGTSMWIKITILIYCIICRAGLDQCDEDASHSGAIAVQLQL